MANIKTEVSKIDDRKKAAKKGFLLPYQLDWVYDENRFKIGEKSIRVGFTYAQEFAAVRGRIQGISDYLHSSVTQNVALNFVRECQFWINEYKVKGTQIGEMEFVENLEKKTKERAFFIEFPGGKRIVSFSSSPNSVRGFGGAVGIDEIAFHPDMVAMMKGAGGRSLWGDPVAMWSSHNGIDTEFNRFLIAERALGPASKWSIHRVTIVDAIAQGLVEKINEVKGTNFTREIFLQDCEAAVGGREAFEEECLCEPRERGRAAVSWFDIQAAQQDYHIYVVQIKGDAQKGDELDPSVAYLLQENPFQSLNRSKQYSLGFDIARTGHLSSIPIFETDGKRHRLVMHIKFHKCKFSSQRETIALALKTLPGLTGEGDSTGLGMQICEELAGRFPGRFTGVNFSAFKPYLGSKLTGALEDGRLIIPKDEEEISYDIRGIKTTQSGTRTIYTESKNPVNELSHCDIAWGIAMGIANAEDGASNGPCAMEPAGQMKDSSGQAINDRGYTLDTSSDDEQKSEWGY